MVRSIKSAKKIKRKNKGSKKGESSSVPSAPAKVWQPGVDALEEGEELQFDPSAYNHLRGFSIGWPCLSFDIVHDSLGLVRTEFPHTVYGVGGTQVWDISSHLNDLAESVSSSTVGGDNIHRLSPLVKFGGHKDEGYAIDWSPTVPGRLVSGDCNSCIHLWEPSETWNVDATPFAGHTASVEDLQWSPTEPDVFASCSVDGTVAIWDTRLGKSPALSVKAHNIDVNVISWNRLASCMIASGADDGTFSIRDLRLIKGDSLVAHFEYHKQPITSIEWCPHEASTLAVSSADNQLTIWDLSLERDEEEETEFKAKLKEQASAPQDLPPQLLFVHQGQKDPKELHWHTQIPGMIMSTAIDGFNVLMPANIENVLPPADA
ncbi:hypothetical protein ZIOFF_074825 [Zingiber officinale]|uniref:Histone-binding protein RBBP4-like N-terminal domain-containing protein n=1 Tax=Zingiber officinale TaxID=94328 RepID=A0A8J5ESY8_ZINOF|nr:hypothetical protein ZIOFF_074825 [Zingiber officinale]